MISFIANFWWIFVIIGIVLLLGLLGYYFDHQTVSNENNTNNLVNPSNNDFVPVVENNNSVKAEDIPIDIK